MDQNNRECILAYLEESIDRNISEISGIESEMEKQMLLDVMEEIREFYERLKRSDYNYSDCFFARDAFAKMMQLRVGIRFYAELGELPEAFCTPSEDRNVMYDIGTSDEDLPSEKSRILKKIYWNVMGFIIDQKSFEVESVKKAWEEKPLGTKLTDCNEESEPSFEDFLFTSKRSALLLEKLMEKEYNEFDELVGRTV